MPILRRSVPVFAALLLAQFAVSPAQAGQMTVRVTNAAATGEGQRGELLAQVFDDAAAFKDGKGPVARLRVPLTEAVAEIAVPALPPGRYAVRVFQDLNGNGRFDTGLFGIPLEPFGFSNDALGERGPPSFEAAAVELGAEPLAVSIRLNR